MTFIPVNFDEVVEPQPAPAGRYYLQITEAKLTKTGAQSKNPGTPIIRVSIGFPENPDFQNIGHFVSLPNEFDSADDTRFKVLLLKRFCALFGVPLDKGGIDTEQLPMEMIGASAEVEVSLTEPNEEDVVYNEIRVPKLRGEPDKYQQ